jgi:hypothetical protein
MVRGGCEKPLLVSRVYGSAFIVHGAGHRPVHPAYLCRAYLGTTKGRSRIFFKLTRLLWHIIVFDMHLSTDIPHEVSNYV